MKYQVGQRLRYTGKIDKAYIDEGCLTLPKKMVGKEVVVVKIEHTDPSNQDYLVDFGFTHPRLHNGHMMDGTMWWCYETELEELK